MRDGLAIERWGSGTCQRIARGIEVRKGQVFRYFVRSRSCAKKVVTAKPRSLDATPTQHNRRGSTQSSVRRLLCPVRSAKMERLSDMYISTLSKIIEAMGSELQIIAKMDGNVKIRQFTQIRQDESETALALR